MLYSRKFKVHQNSIWTWMNISNFCQPCLLQDSSETVGVVLDMLKTILPSLTDNYLKVSPMGSTQRAQKALYTLHNTPKLTQPTDELMVCTCLLTSWVYFTIRHYDLYLDWTLNIYQKKSKCTLQCTYVHKIFYIFVGLIDHVCVNNRVLWANYIDRWSFKLMFWKNL